jgi:fused signal recognition particle receptor
VLPAPVDWPYIGQLFKNANAWLELAPIPHPAVTIPTGVVLALLLLWIVIRLVRWRRGAPAELPTKPKRAAKPVVEEEPEEELTDEEIEAQLAGGELTPEEEAELIAEAEAAGEVEEVAEEEEAAPELPAAAELEAVTPPEAAEGAVEAIEEVPEEEVVEEAPPVEEPKISFFARLRQGLAKTAGGLVGRIDKLIRGRKIDAAFFDELEEILFTADLGPTAAQKLLTTLQARVKEEKVEDAEAIRTMLKDEIKRILAPHQAPLDTTQQKPFVIMVVGVNGVGKTTTIGKVANMTVKDGRTVIMGAADTFRAAADEQLTIWSQRVGAEIVKQKPGADPAAVAYDTVQAAVNRGVDVVIVDTAGRLHTKHNLMEELKKVKRVMAKVQDTAPHEVLLVLDANTGQNAIAQAKTFHEALGLTGIILTKLDGTAKGGCIVGICDELAIPVRYIGIGERMDDLRPFNADDFVEALFEAAEG